MTLLSQIAVFFFLILASDYLVAWDSVRGKYSVDLEVHPEIAVWDDLSTPPMNTAIRYAISKSNESGKWGYAYYAVNDLIAQNIGLDIYIHVYGDVPVTIHLDWHNSPNELQKHELEEHRSNVIKNLSESTGIERLEKFETSLGDMKGIGFEGRINTGNGNTTIFRWVGAKDAKHYFTYSVPIPDEMIPSEDISQLRSEIRKLESSFRLVR